MTLLNPNTNFSDASGTKRKAHEEETIATRTTRIASIC